MLQQLSRLLEPIQRGILSMIGKAILLAADDTTDLQTLKMEVMKDEIIDEIERVQNFGFTSRPQAGAEVVILSVGGDRTNTIAIAVDDSRIRIKNLGDGESAVYNAHGEIIKLQNGKIIITSPNIYIGGETDAEPIPLGDALKTYFDSFIDAFISNWVVVPTDGGGALKAALVAWQAAHSLDNYLSTKHKVN